MRAVLLGPLEAPYPEQKKLFASLKIRRSTDILIGVDGGTSLWQKWGFTPQLAVGDWDSLGKKKKILQNFPHITLSRTKDRSDLFFAVLAAIEMGAQEVVCLGVTGGRPDHHLAMIYDLSNFSAGLYGPLKKIQAIGPEGEYNFLSRMIPRWKGVGPVNQIVSIFAVQGEARGVTLKGFEFGLKNAVLKASSHGLSNRTSQKRFEVCLRNGQLLVIMLRNGTD